MKRYIKPKTKAYKLKGESLMLDHGSVGVTEESTLGDVYNPNDVTYTKPNIRVADDEHDDFAEN